MEALDAHELRSEKVFREDFFRSLEKSRKRFAQQSDSNSSLFMGQTFSVKAAQLPNLRRRLANIIHEFAKESESYDGELLADICLSLTHNRS